MFLTPLKPSSQSSQISFQSTEKRKIQKMVSPYRNFTRKENERMRKLTENFVEKKQNFYQKKTQKIF